MEPTLIQEVILSNDQFLMLYDSINNLAFGIHFIMTILATFLVWKVINLLYKLFGGVFFGGV